MARNRGHARWLRLGVAMTSWGLALVAAEALLGAEMANPARELEQRIELRLKGRVDPPPQTPARSHEEESFEPWELVGV
jgi:hypothetical protein